MGVGKALLRGVGRALSSPRLLLWLWLVNFVVAVPAAVVVGGAIRSSLGPSLVADHLRHGFDMGWYGELHQAAQGLAKTFSPTLLGAGAFYDNLEAWWSGRLFTDNLAIAGVGALYALLWALMLGGVLERFARPPGRFALGAFFAGGGRYFLRFVRLAILSGVLYYLVFRLAGRLFPWLEKLTRDATAEKTVFAADLLGFALVVGLLVLINMSFDYAKIATVVEERRSMLLAALRGVRFVLANLGRTWGLYVALAAVGGGLLAGYALLAPGAAQSTAVTVAVAFLAGQLFLFAKLALRLAFYGGEMALYQAPDQAPRGAPVEPPRGAPVEPPRGAPVEPRPEATAVISPPAEPASPAAG